jgi:regulator of protease activity HflC (stomatin/prohibitin superfamily)
VAEFHEARAKDRGADELAAIARAAVEARVGTLLVDAGRQAAGRIDRATGDIERVDLSEPDADDLIDDLGELVLEQKGDVVVVPSDRMPTASGAAAIFRY